MLAMAVAAACGNDRHYSLSEPLGFMGKDGETYRKIWEKKGTYGKGWENMGRSLYKWRF
jgi:hypothetical protein